MYNLAKQALHHLQNGKNTGYSIEFEDGGVLSVNEWDMVCDKLHTLECWFSRFQLLDNGQLVAGKYQRQIVKISIWSSTPLTALSQILLG